MPVTIHEPYYAGPEIRLFVGLDLGQASDSPALAVLQRTISRGALSAVTFARPELVRFDVRFAQRWALHTSYPDVVARVDEILWRLAELFPDAGVELAFDRTGVGRAVGDLLWMAPFFRQPRRGSAERRICPVTLTAGSVERSAVGGVNVPKSDVVGALAVLFQSGVLRIAEALPDRREIELQLVNFRRFVSGDRGGAETFANDGKLAKHDDYVTALGLAAWRAQRDRRPGAYTNGILPGGLSGVSPI